MKRIVLLLFFLSLLAPLQIFAEDFVLDSNEQEGLYESKLPSGTTVLSFDLDMEMPVSEDTVPLFNLIGPNKNLEPLVHLQISDIKCTGEYQTEVVYLPNKQHVQASYFKTRTPWPETISVRIETNNKTKKGYEHTIFVNEEVQKIYTWKKLKPFEFSVMGRAYISNLKITKKERSP